MSDGNDILMAEVLKRLNKQMPHTYRAQHNVIQVATHKQIWGLHNPSRKVMAPGTGRSLTERTRLEDSYLPTVKPQLQQPDHAVHGRRTGTDQWTRKSKTKDLNHGLYWFLKRCQDYWMGKFKKKVLRQVAATGRVKVDSYTSFLTEN